MMTHDSNHAGDRDGIPDDIDPSSAFAAGAQQPIYGPTIERDALGRRVIQITTNESHVVAQVIAALAERGAGIYTRGGLLVHVVCDEHKGGLRIARAVDAHVREVLTDCAAFAYYSRKTKDWVPAHPPEWVVKELVARDQWPELRQLDGIAEHPVFRADGTLLNQPGYDAATRLYLASTAEMLPVPEHPSLADALLALGQLEEVIEDFPFGRPEHKSAALAAVLTPFVRHMHCENVPLFLVDSNVRGSGKGLLADAVTAIATGRPLARTCYPADNEEIRKMVLAKALSGAAFTLLDNVARPLGGEALDPALTATHWGGRLLGVTKEVSLPLRTTWFATGNNVQLTGDMARRCLHVRLESPLEVPEERKDLMHDPLLPWVLQERPRLMRAACTILRAYFTAIGPNRSIPTWGSFTEWSNVVRGCLVWLGLTDPFDGREGLMEEADTERSALAKFLAALAVYAPYPLGWSAKQVLDRAMPHRVTGQGGDDELLESINDLCSDLPPGAGINTRTLGTKLRKVKGRTVEGMRLEAAGGATQSKKSNKWCVRTVP